MASARRPNEPSAPTDSDLIAGLLVHDEAALRGLIASCGKHVYGKALQIVIEPGLAEEVAQDTLLVLWWHPERFEPNKGSIRSYLMAIARFKAIDMVRREEKIRTKETLLQGSGTFLEASPVDDNVENGMVMREAIAQLPATKRKVIFLAFYRGLTYRQVAEVLELPEGTVKTRIRDSLVRLKMAIPDPETA